MKKNLIAILLLILTPSFILAQDISVEDLLGTDKQDEASGNIEEVEEGPIQQKENVLKISIPKYTDNPSHIITFVDPSEEKSGVEIDIDESGYKEINSPYSLPSLGIGKHHLKFRFVDSIGATKVLEYDIIIIPRPPIIKAPQFSENNLLLSGTGLAGSEVTLIISVGANNYTQMADIDSEGNWNTSISMDSVANGIYTIFGYTRKNGYASNPSESAVMEYGNQGIVQVSDRNKEIYFDFNGIKANNIVQTIKQNPDLLIAFISFLLIGVIATVLVFTFTKRVGKKGEEKDISTKISGNNQKNEKTLLELFGTSTEEKKDKKEKKPKIKKTKKEKVITKTDFLKDFEKFDPDKDSGKENPEPKEKDKKDVIVTLTSSREE
ncbi:MAG: hypothetical protein PHG60_00375 [Candidatus Dojkabacteria bacterium]|jgi:hypothetical protein|nr:hypothetical protein [Candidatus Dojkabacteria bacterium]MDD2270034.1 hypothetical protein [Candidatus Dojkabacteria bacterium]